MPIIVDIVLVAIFIFTVFNGYRKGFIRTLFGLAGVFVALSVASIFSSGVGEAVSDAFVEDSVKGIIQANLSESLSDGEIDRVIDKICDYAPTQDMGDRLTEVFTQKGRESIEVISSELANKISRPLCSSIAYLVLFVAAYFATRLAAYLLDRIFKLPVLRFANSWLGATVGAVCGVLILMVLSRIVGFVLPWLSQSFPETFVSDFTDKTLILKFFCEYNLFSTLMIGVIGIIV